MGRFHRHDDGTVHAHDHGDHPHEHHHHHDHGHGHDHGHAHDHAHDLSHVDADSAEHGDHTGYDTGRERVAAAFAAIPRTAELLHFHVNVDDTVTVLAVDDDIYADTPFHGYPVRGEVRATIPLPAPTVYDATTVERLLRAGHP